MAPILLKRALGQEAPGAHTSWGAPELTGMWEMTPLERLSELEGKDVLTDEEAAEYERNELQELDKDRGVSDGFSAVQDGATPTTSFGGTMVNLRQGAARGGRKLLRKPRR